MLKSIRLTLAAIFLLNMQAISAYGETGFMAGAHQATISLPVYVKHSTQRHSDRDWNEGFLNNPGVVAEVTKEMKPFEDIRPMQAGFTFGGYNNSYGKPTFLAGVVGEFEWNIDDMAKLHVGTPVGLVTGYRYLVTPAAGPYIGVSKKVMENLEVGVRGQWLPAKTVSKFVGKDRDQSDAYVALVTLARSF